jgi:NADPH-dependent ferric siderophore reductase
MNNVKQKTIAFLERKLVRSATVLAVRAWEPASFIEIDLHLPGVDMNKWDEVQHIKCKVGPLIYRDYTPMGWDADTQTCTLFIDAAHEGPGSRWAKALERGDTLSYLGISSSHHQLVRNKRLVFLGDETSIGHFLALRQLVDGQQGMSVCGAIAIAEKHHQDEFGRYFPHSGLEAVNKRYGTDYIGLETWIDDHTMTDPSDTIFYLAGYIPAMMRLRKMLRQKGYANGQVKVQGFWD